MSNVDSGRENNLQQESEHCDGIIDTSEGGCLLLRYE